MKTTDFENQTKVETQYQEKTQRVTENISYQLLRRNPLHCITKSLPVMRCSNQHGCIAVNSGVVAKTPILRSYHFKINYLKT